LDKPEEAAAFSLRNAAPKIETALAAELDLDRLAEIRVHTNTFVSDAC
jgi:hypothetical protein